MSPPDTRGRDLLLPETTNASLLDAVGRLLDRGAVLGGGITISVADVDLVVLDLRLLLAAAETIERATGAPLRPRLPSRSADPPPRRATRPPTIPESAAERILADGPRVPDPPPASEDAPAPQGQRIQLDPENAEKGLARLVLTLIDFIRRLLERQAIKRMEGGQVDEESIERLGDTLARLEERVNAMKETFGLADEDLDLDLGPLGMLSGPDR